MNIPFVPKYLVFFAIAMFSIVTASCSGSQKAAVSLEERLEMAHRYSSDKSGDALLVWRNGKILMEEYHQGYEASDPHVITEISTLLSGLMALRAASEGVITLDQLVSKIITEWQGDSLKASITISQLLHYTSGLEPGRGKLVPGYEQAIQAPLVHSPGDAFTYGPTGYQVFCALMSRLDKGRDLGYLKEKVLNPLGIPGGRWQPASMTKNDNLNTITDLEPRCFDGAHLTARELLKIGQVLLHDGRWEGKQLIRDTSAITEPSPASPGYGLSVWLNAGVDEQSDNQFLTGLPDEIMLLRGYNKRRLIYDGAPPDLFMAAGRYNQRLYAIPSMKMIIVRLGRADLTWSDARFLARLLDGKTP